MLDRLPAAVREQLGPRHTVKVRVTYDQKTNNVLAAIVKARIADLSILIPQSPLDCRISINFEMKWDGDIDEIIGSGYGSKIPDRQKDRVSYKQGLYQVDLTQVTQTTTVNVSFILYPTFHTRILTCLTRTQFASIKNMSSK